MACVPACFAPPPSPDSQYARSVHSCRYALMCLLQFLLGTIVRIACNNRPCVQLFNVTFLIGQEHTYLVIWEDTIWSVCFGRIHGSRLREGATGVRVCTHTYVHVYVHVYWYPAKHTWLSVYVYNCVLFSSQKVLCCDVTKKSPHTRTTTETRRCRRWCVCRPTCLRGLWWRPLCRSRCRVELEP